MAFLLGDAIKAVRFRHPAYADPSLVPTVTLVAEASRLQRRFMEAGAQAYSGFMAHQVPIYLALDTNNLPATVAAGTTGGLPVRSADQPLTVTAGFAPHYDLDSAEVIVSDFVATTVAIGASTTVITLTGAGRTVNADVAYYVQIVGGPGLEPDAIRSINSNTATTWTVDNFRVDPAATSVFRIIAITAQDLDTDATVVTQLPSTRQEAAYLMKLDANGQPYVDLTTPLVATLREGVPLPPHYMLLQLEVPRVAPGSFPPDPTVNPVLRQDPIQTIPIFHGMRRQTLGPAAFVEGERLYLGGDNRTWGSAANLILTFVPIPPDFDTTSRTVLSTPFLLPDTASEALIAGLVLAAARQAFARGKVDQTALNEAQADAMSERALWLTSLKRRANTLNRQAARLR